MKKKITVITILLFVAVMCCVLTACADPHEHELQHFEAKEPTCTDEGNIEYWYCAGCGKYFADNTAKHELKKVDTVISASNNHIWGDWVAEGNISCTTGGIFYRKCEVCGCKETETFPAGGHELSYIEEVSPSCTAAGIMAHWHCNVCGKNYADEKCSDELNTVEIEKLEHKPEYVAAKDATCGQEGNKSYWICVRCNGTFSDKECDNPVDLLDLIIPETENHIFAEEWVMTKEPTKTEQGLKIKKCMYCSSSISQEVDTIDYEYTEGLNYNLNETNTGYIVEYDLFQDPIMINGTIAPHAVWKGLPVVGINSIEEEDAVCLIIPETVKNLGYESLVGFEAAHKDMPNLSTIIVVDENPYFTSEDGIVYNKDKTELWLYPAKREVYEFAVPDTVKTIKEGAFWEAPITFLNLNEGLEIFERGGSFNGLKKINIPSTIKCITPINVESNALPETIEFIGSSGPIISSDNFTWYKNGWYWGSENNQYFALVGRRYLNVNIEVHPQTEIIAAGVGAGVSVYYGETFVIPDSVRIVCGKLFNSGGVDNIEIGKNAYFYDENPFSGMVRIKKFSVDPENPYYTTDDKGVLYSKDFKTLICYPGYSDYTSYTINEQCEEIAMGAFAATSFNHLMLQKITIPENVVKIGDDAFEGIFFKNKGLTDVYYQGNLSGWLEIDFGTNYSNPMAYADNLYINGKLLQGEIIIPEGTEKIGDYAFSGCSGLTSISIPDRVTSIGDRAFSNCDGLTSITIPNSVTRIGSYAFRDCSGLTSITIPDSVKSIGDGASYNCNALTIYCEVASKPDGWNDRWNYNCPVVWNCNNNEADKDGNIYYIADNGIRYALNNGTATVIRQSVMLSGEIIIPEEITYKDVAYSVSITNIGNYTFHGCSGLTSITIPNSVTRIGSYAFRDCSGLTSITIPDSVKSIGDCAFMDCSGLTSITIPESVTSIGDSAFSGCSGLTSITIGDSVTSIGEYAFFSCRGLTSITIPDSVASIGYGAFSSCSGLTSITIGDSVTSIGQSAFIGCSGIIQIENGINYVDNWAIDWDYAGYQLRLRGDTVGIADQAFAYLSIVTSITIPDSVTSIGNSVFYKCSGLTNINYQGTMAQWNTISKDSNWSSNTGDFTITCTDGTLDKEGNQV